MIGRLTGILAEKSPPQLLLDVNGVGYEIDVPMSSFYNLPALGEKVTLLTHFVVREDAQVLFGFLTHEERATFRLLVKISGVARAPRFPSCRAFPSTSWRAPSRCRRAAA